MTTLTIEVPEKLIDDIASEAERRKLSKKQVIRERLQKPAKPTMWDLTRDLVIDDPNSPGDLSTNKKHMAGYGGNRPR